MKDFDIEKLERKNIYRTPDNFFADMQANVLREVAPAPQAKVISLNWAYAAAVAVATIFGVTFMMNQDEAEPQIVQNDQQVSPPPSARIIEETVPEATLAYQTFEEDLTSVETDNQKDVAAPTMIAAKQKSEKIEVAKSTAVSPEVQVDQILANISLAELADLGKNAEQDVYLDLYY